MSTNANASRATDAKLHELLFGAKPWTFSDDLGTRLVVWTGMSTFESLPHYSANLNDIAQGEQTLTLQQRADYAEELYGIMHGGWALVIPAGAGSICTDGYTFSYTVMFRLITATAAQRAQALVAVLERVRGEVGT